MQHLYLVKRLNGFDVSQNLTSANTDVTFYILCLDVVFCKDKFSLLWTPKMYYVRYSFRHRLFLIQLIHMLQSTQELPTVLQYDDV